MNVSLAFYKAAKGTWVDKVVGWWTRPSFFKFWELGYSHVEFLFDNNECFSSSPRDNGTRWKVIDNIHTSGKWDIYPLSTDDFYIRNLILKCDKLKDMKYDWLCIFFTHFLPLELQDRKKIICSELVAQEAFELNHPYRFSPNSLFYFLKTIKFPIMGIKN